MTNGHVLDDLAAYLSGDLNGEKSENVRAHLESCPSCREEFRSMNALWEALGREPEQKPDESVRMRFYKMLETYKEEAPARIPAGHGTIEGWIRRVVFTPPAARLAFGFAALAGGILLGYHLKSERVDGAELAQLHEEVRGVSRLLTISLLQQESASERLRGVSWSYRTEEPDPEVTAALVHTLRYDANVNVRLAALDALTRALDQSGIRQDLLRSLPQQPSPLVQAAIVDVMIQIHEKSSLEVFRQMARDTSLNGSVRKKVEQGIQQLI